jgi:hypothetical protein
MELEHARRVMETSNPETVNQYLRFGWKLVNQHLVDQRDGTPPRTNYILASFRALEDTRQVVALDSAEEVNRYLNLGWRLIDKIVRQGNLDGPRHESIQFVLVWAGDEPPQLPGMERAIDRLTDPEMFNDLGDFSSLPTLDENSY